MIDLHPACRRMTDVLAGVGDDRLDGPTPCADYTVRDLIDHIGMAARDFGAVARKESDGPAAQGEGWRDGVARHVAELGDAWDDPAAWQGSSSPGGLELSNELWGRIALTEMVVHGWDLAQATGQPFTLPEETLRACLDHVAEFVPNAPVPELWGPAVGAGADAPMLDRIVALTGRTP